MQNIFLKINYQVLDKKSRRWDTINQMSSSVTSMVKDYLDWKAQRERIGSLDELAAKHGVSRQQLLYYVRTQKNPTDATDGGTPDAELGQSAGQTKECTQC